MIFLIEYHRAEGRVIEIKQFEESQRQMAIKARLDSELGHARTGTPCEVVLLEADSETALRKTHRRYFEDLSDLTKSTKK